MVTCPRTSERSSHQGGSQRALCSLRSWRHVSWTATSSILLFYVFGLENSAFGADPNSATGASRQKNHSADDGFTRDSITTLDQPAATSASPNRSSHPTTSSKVNSAKTRTAANRLHLRHRRGKHSKPVAAQSVAVTTKARPRSAVGRFIYWWNGWVIRNFHTKNGTVLYDKVGADTSRLPVRG